VPRSSSTGSSYFGGTAFERDDIPLVDVAAAFRPAPRESQEQQNIVRFDQGVQVERFTFSLPVGF
jgi:hypothetical protein